MITLMMMMIMVMMTVLMMMNNDDNDDDDYDDLQTGYKFMCQSGAKPHLTSFYKISLHKLFEKY